MKFDTQQQIWNSVTSLIFKNSRWWTAAILKIVFWPNSDDKNPISDFSEILHREAE